MNRHARGFTLLELMMVIVIAAVLIGVGVPSFRDFVRDSRMTSAANDLVTAMQTARTEAVKRQNIAVICSSADPLAAAPSCGAGSGWIVWADLNADLTPDTGEPMLIQHEALPTTVIPAPRDPTGASISGAWAVAFTDSGLSLTLPTGGTLTQLRNLVLCDDRGNVKSYGDLSAARLVSITTVGRPSVSRSISEINAAGGCGSGT